MRVAGLELIKLSHISLDICLCCPSLEYIKMELHKFNSTKFLMNTQQPSKLNTKTKRNTNFSIRAFEVPFLSCSCDCLVDVWKVSGLCLRAASGAKGYFVWMTLTCQNHANYAVMLTFCLDRCRNALCFLCYVLFIFFITRYQAFSFAPSILPHFYKASLTQ